MTWPMVALGFATPQSAADLYIEQGTVYVFKGAALMKYRQADQQVI